GESEIKVENSMVTPDSLVLISYEGYYDNYDGFVKIEGKDNGGFYLVLRETLEEEIIIKYLIVN
ncbi:hypothetical protein JW796_01130, partial [Candidatus Dojkabacteria bacterium]|nr:hypothetical protein [Candidatus Dojkabacteria bacterium]